eukprot:scaffold15436_cov221-Alexandrium_tamarense.AAC.5
MKLIIAALSLTCAAAFTPAAPSLIQRSAAAPVAAQTVLFADPNEEEAGLDLDLEEIAVIAFVGFVRGRIC